ncbi:major capsid protein [Capybara microvirus Cap1_SP_116]|nr:major capsid protein [Capybara microvirus Cap1_SP_116]
MAQNPSQSRVTSGHDMHHDSANNRQSITNHESYNSFRKSHSRYMTARFEDIKPIFCQDALVGDVVPLRETHDLRTYTLAHPLLNDVIMDTDYYQVPMSAILPNTWEYIVKNPVYGDDIPDAAKPLLDWTLVSSYLNSNLTASNNNLLYKVQSLFLFSAIFGRDGLLANLGFQSTIDGDDCITKLVSVCATQGNKITYHTTSATASGYFTFDSSTPVLSHLNFIDSAIKGEFKIDSCYFYIQDSAKPLPDSVTNSVLNLLPQLAYIEPISLERVIAYHGVCCQYCTNTMVDSYYTLDKWLENMRSLGDQAIGSTPVYWTLNGVRHSYDIISSGYISSILGKIQNSNSFYFLLNLFSYHRSLRYGDYFTSARTRPLAVGDVNISVSGSSVSAIDVNRNMWKQRFFNSVQRTSQNIYDYLQSQFGTKPERIAPQPNFICSQEYKIGGMEVENTANNQGNVVTLLRSGASNYLFEVFIDEPSIVIGTVSFRMHMPYYQGYDKAMANIDRFQRFNPYLQHVGEQSISLRELRQGDLNNNSTFGYQLRYAEYKNAISRATGGFASGALKGWVALFESLNNSNVIDSNFIRNHNEDVDSLYSSLTATNLCDYFHFQIAFHFEEVVNSKQQSYPSLLQ